MPQVWEIFTGVCTLKLEPVKMRDIDEIEAILKPITGEMKIRRRIKQHINVGLCRLIRDDEGKICALALAATDGKRVSLTNYWIREDKRKTLMSLFMFIGVFAFFKDKEVYIRSKDISTFQEYVEPTGKKDEYRFIGVGSNIDPDKLVKMLERKNG